MVDGLERRPKLGLVVGCADRVWDEVEQAQKLATYDEIYAVKMAGIYWDQGFFHWPSLHTEYMRVYKEERRKLGLPDCYEVVGPLVDELGRHWEHPVDRRTSFRWPEMTGSGSSGLFAVKVAFEDGCDKVVLAGVPMTKDGNHFARGRPWVQRDCFIEAWTQTAPRLRGRVRSFSGWTKDLLGGAPDAAWLAAPRDAA